MRYTAPRLGNPTKETKNLTNEQLIKKQHSKMGFFVLITQILLALFTGLVPTIIANLILVALLLKDNTTRYFDFIKIKKFKLSLMGIFLLITSFCCLYLVNIGTSLLEHNILLSNLDKVSTTQIEFTVKTVLTSLAYYAILPAILEELVYRGAILHISKKFCGNKVAIVFSSTLFALIHENPFQNIYTFIVGIFLACIVIYFDSLFPSIMLHFAINTFSLFQGYLPAEAVAIVFIIATVMTIFGFIVFLINIRKTTIFNDDEILPYKTSKRFNLAFLNAGTITCVIFLAMVAVYYFIVVNNLNVTSGG